MYPNSGKIYTILYLGDITQINQSICTCSGFTNFASFARVWQFPNPIYQRYTIVADINQVQALWKLEVDHGDTVLVQSWFDLSCAYSWIFIITCQVKIYQINTQPYISHNMLSQLITWGPSQ